jgi:Chromosome condensation complex Condensin, subunit G
MNTSDFTKELAQLLAKRARALRFEELAQQCSLKRYQIDYFVAFARKKLDQNHTPTMLVTEYYFAKGEPTDRARAVACCALHGRRAVGIRRLFAVRNDLLGQTWLRLNQRNSFGIQTHNLDRIAVGHHLKFLTTAKAQALVDEMREAPQLPYHEKEFAKLMGLTSAQLKDKNE